MATDSSAATEHLIAHLHDLERRGAARVAALRAAEAPAATRPGVLFRLAGHRLLTPLDRLLGVWPLPRTLTTVPGAARWVLGVANQRGELLPLFDLRGLLLADFEGIQRRGIALVVAGRSRAFGAVVDAVIGLRRTRFQAPEPAQLADAEPLSALIVGCCECAEGNVAIVDLTAIEGLRELTTGVRSYPAPALAPAPARAPAPAHPSATPG
ncbi:MAG: chemotaxis protein CheW [Thiohalocapsa sp.]|jgi:chemotaxis signal transduction protein|uniref:chemotaxis protein CheW n=1 Tax=Thiohalocapsa sp. TaxID=2497641 RepID=UPI0025D05F7E|nr:chemotaxis protein CheW [Thiohalocapsa sp.]MCG6942671.1 chemotaxis protein CheW [Thiohalocapsa sp.]